MRHLAHLLALAAFTAGCVSQPPLLPVPTTTPPTLPEPRDTVVVLPGVFVPNSGRAAMLSDSITPEEMARRVQQFAPADFDYNKAALAPWEKQVLRKLVQASDVLNEIYWLQVHPQLPAWRAQLAADSGAGRTAALEYFDIMAGPWDRLKDNQPFLEVGPKPPGGGFYPLDMTKQEFDSYLAAHPNEKDALTGYFTIVTRDAANAKRLVTVPYSTAYRSQLERAAGLLRDAAALAQNASLADFLRKRAAAFLSNDYYASDVAWMDIAGSHIEPTIGPYEVYDDELFGYKAAFESFIAVADDAASAELAGLKSHMRELESRLPVAAKYRNPNRSFESPIRVVDLVYNSGEARNGIQTIAYNLPNDERVIAQKGSKKVMLRNVMRAKFDKILMPIASDVFPSSIVAQIEFQPWFINVLMHELAHGLGPQSVNKTLKERHSALEEAKADVTGLYNIGVLAERGLYSKDFVRQAYFGHAADLFRSTRFGTADAHGQAALIQFNWLAERGAIYRTGGAVPQFAIDYDKYVTANRELATEILTIQGTGDYDRAGRLLQQYGTTMRPDIAAAINGLTNVPVDIKPVYMLPE